MSNLVVFSFARKRSSRQSRPGVMDSHFIPHFSTIPGGYSPRNRLEGSHRDTPPLTEKIPIAEISTFALRHAAYLSTCSPAASLGQAGFQQRVPHACTKAATLASPGSPANPSCTHRGRPWAER